MGGMRGSSHKRVPVALKLPQLQVSANSVGGTETLDHSFESLLLSRQKSSRRVCEIPHVRIANLESGVYSIPGNGAHAKLIGIALASQQGGNGGILALSCVRPTRAAFLDKINGKRGCCNHPNTESCFV